MDAGHPLFRPLADAAVIPQGIFVDGREHPFGQYAAAEILNHDFTVCFQDFRTIVEEAITAFILRERVYEILLADDFRSDLNDV